MFFAGMMTKYLRPKTFPAIYVNGEDDSHRRQQVLDNLIGLICELYVGTVKLPECVPYTKNRSGVVAKHTPRPVHVAEEDQEDDN